MQPTTQLRLSQDQQHKKASKQEIRLTRAYLVALVTTLPTLPFEGVSSSSGPISWRWMCLDGSSPNAAVFTERDVQWMNSRVTRKSRKDEFSRLRHRNRAARTDFTGLVRLLPPCRAASALSNARVLEDRGLDRSFRCLRFPNDPPQ